MAKKRRVLSVETKPGLHSEKSAILRAFPNPLFYEQGFRKTAAFIYVLHLVLVIMFTELVVGLYAHVFAGIPDTTLSLIFTSINFFFGATCPLLLTIFAASNVAGKFSPNGDTMNPGQYGGYRGGYQGGYQPPYQQPQYPGTPPMPPYDAGGQSQGNQRGGINIRVGGGPAASGGKLPPLPRDEGGDH